MNHFRHVCKMVLVILLSPLLMASSCMKDPPPTFITTDTPALPSECVAPMTPEPKLPGGGKRDVLVDEAARDREHLRFAYRNEAILRAACKQRLEALFPPNGS